MSRRTETSFGSLPTAAQQHVDSLCNEFESAWRSGATPNIADILERLADLNCRAILFRELLRIDLDWRKRQGSQLTPDDYWDRFPEMATILAEEFKSRRISTIQSRSSSSQ